MLKDFRKFILRGNVVDLAVAVVIGAAFNSVVQSLVKDFITPLITGFSSSGQLVQGVWHITVGDKHFLFNWGDFLNTLISFLIVAAVVFFFVVQPINKLAALSSRSKEAEEPTEKKCPECLSTIPKAATRCAFCTAKLKD
ncbi:MAG TPA: large conductance mechanosensitive channel protein MscL [Candidatus Saccharimonadia bacterium]|nr:large conductance mechanosensitive channel protein MscL [Candidatus Saccharimonadia bacterium]